MITICTLNKDFYELTKAKYNSYFGSVKDYKPVKNNIIYMSPANSLGFMDGGIDKCYMEMFEDIESKVKNMYKNYGKISSLGRPYMPIGSCVLIRVSPNMFIASAPTMWLPQDIRGTNNVYYATMAVLKNVLSRVQENDVEIILTSSGCGYGKMMAQDSFQQMEKAINDYKFYECSFNGPALLAEPNKHEQHNIYMNMEFNQ